MQAYTPGESLESFSRRTGIPIEAIIKLNANESPYGPVPAAIDALRAHAWYNQYPDVCAFNLKDKLGVYTGLDQKHIVLGHGSMEIIAHLWHLFLSPGDSIICCPPTFSLYSSMASICGANIKNVARKASDEIDFQAIQEALTPDVKLIVLCSPNNPTGSSIKENALIDLLTTGHPVILDEAYIEFSSRPAGYAALVARYDNLIILRTFSKWAGLAGLRVGYGLLPEWLVGPMQQIQSPFEFNVAGHLAAIETLQSFNEVQARIHTIIEERQKLFNLLAAQPYLDPFPSEGNFILARLLKKGVSIEQIRKTMEQHGILLRYFPQLESHQDYVRVTVGLPEHTQKLTDALATIKALDG